MNAKLHIKKGDTVKVLAGNSRGMQGKVLVINAKDSTAIVEGISLVSKHTKPNAKNTQGGIVKQEAPVHISNLMVVDAKGNATRIGRKLDTKSEKLVRYSIKSGEVIK